MRVTGGTHKGRVINVPAGNSVRPTSDRMRESLFNILNHASWVDNAIVDDAHVMDMFCGSGALGIEALSRGAAHCVFVDNAALSLQFVKDNTAYLPKDDYQIIKASADKLSPRPSHVPPRDLVFMDPPYFKGLVDDALSVLVNGGWMTDGAVIIAETEKGANIVLADMFQRLDHRVQGTSELHILRYKPAINQD